MLARMPAVAAVLLTVTGELEVLLASADAGDRLVSALAVPALTLPLAWSRRAPAPALAVIALALALQAVLGGLLVGPVVTTIAVLALALYFAGRYVAGAWSLAGMLGAAAVVAATRIVFDPAAGAPREAVLTCVAVASPLLVGRWARGQRLLQRELADNAVRRARDRARDVRHAADEERGRIAADLQLAVAGGLRTIVADASALEAGLRAGDETAARERLAGIADTARGALADVRRVLGVLRNDAEAPPLAPPRAHVRAPRAAAPPPSPAAEPSRDHADRTLGPLGDALPVAIVLAVATLELATGTSAVASLTALPIAAPLLWRRRRPVAAALAVLGAIALQSILVALDSFPLGDILAMVVATYAVGAHADRRSAFAGLVLVAAGAAAHAVVFYPGGVAAALLGGVALPWTVGRIVRANRDLTREGRRRNREIEEVRAREAAAAVTRERLQVARELHDAVAHNISVIAIQAGGAEGLVGRDPARAGECVRLIAAVAEEALAELARLAGLPADRDAGADAPPSLARVDQLAGRARAAGLTVTVSLDGRPPTLPAGIELAAFRIVQEALANTAKHARADRAWVRVRFAARAIELEIGDDGRGPHATRTPDGGGHGLLGMRERVALYGGSLDVGARSGGGYLVRARLPIEGT